MRYSDTPSAALLLLLACSDTSIGSDECTGEQTRCDATEVVKRPTELPLPADTMNQVDTSALPELQPDWQRALEIFPEQSPGLDELSDRAGKLVGNGQAGLWYIKRSVVDKVEIHQLDEDGTPTASTVIEQPPSTLIDQPGRMFFLGTDTLNDEGRAPVLKLNWSSICVGPDATDCGNPVVETVALHEDLEQEPLRVQHGTEGPPVHAAQAEDGGIWTFDVGVLRKYDARASISIQQTLLAQASPYPTTIDVWDGGYRRETLMALSPSGSLYVYSFAPHGRPELWRLDEHGNVERRYRTPLSPWGNINFYGRAIVSLAIDKQERPVLFSETAAGDLLVYRLDSQRNEAELHLVMREDFTSLAPTSLSEDRAGNLYVLSVSGPRRSPVPMLCKLVLSGELSCFTLPTLAPLALGTLRVVGGAENVVYVHGHIAGLLGAEDAKETLARFQPP